MTIFGLGEIIGFPKGYMARKRGQKDESGAGQELVAEYLSRLVQAGEQRAVFEVVLADIKSDGRLQAADVVAIAHRYNEGGKKPSSRTTALATISKRFVEIVRFHAKNRIAEKVRPW